MRHRLNNFFFEKRLKFFTLRDVQKGYVLLHESEGAHRRACENNLQTLAVCIGRGGIVRLVLRKRKKKRAHESKKQRRPSPDFKDVPDVGFCAKNPKP